MKRRGSARIELIDNGFILYHDYPNSVVARPVYFQDLDELFDFLDKKVFADLSSF